MMWLRGLTGCALALGLGLAAQPARADDADRIFDKSTVWRPLTPNDKLVVYGIDDPSVAGVACWYTQPEKGGIKGTLGLAEDVSDISLACRQVGPVSFTEPLKQRDEVFSERQSILFKRLRVVRLVDAKRNTLIYLSYSDRLVDGSPQNSVTAVPVDRATPIPVK